MAQQKMSREAKNAMKKARHVREKIKRNDEAKQRQLQRTLRGDAEQLELLKMRPGKSAKETARLQKKLKEVQA